MYKIQSEKKDYLILFLVGLILLFFRSAYTLLVPCIYTEDGVWMSSILNNGFLNTLFHARGDYLVCGNILLLGIVLLLNNMLFGENLNYLPQLVTIVHYCFYSLFALLPVICFKKDVRKSFRLLMWFLILTVPLGISAMELMGKISNIGYLCYDIAFLLLFYKISNRQELGKLPLAVVDILLLICCTTHPGSYVLVGTAFFIDIAIQLKSMENIPFVYKVQDLFTSYYNREWILLGCFCVVFASYDIFVLTADLYDGMGMGFTLGTKLTIEFISRFFIFYIVYPFYSNLTDPICLTILAILCIASLYVFVSKKIPKTQKFYLAMILFATFVYFIITVATRQGMLLPLLSNYTTSYADRYYYGINILAMLAIIYMLNLLTQYTGIASKLFAVLTTAILLINPFVDLSYIFQYDKEITGWSHVIPFSERIKEATYDANSGKYIVNIDPESFSVTMQIDEKQYLASLQNIRHTQPLTAANLTDGNWTNGIGVQAGLDNVILLEGKWLSLIENCTSLTSGTQTVNILEIRDYGQWVHVVCDTTDLQAFSYPNEITYTLKLKQTDG